MNTKSLQIINVLLLVFFLTNCVPIATPTPLVTNTPTFPAPTKTPEPFSLVPSLDDEAKMSECTLEDFQSGKYSDWLHTIVDKTGNLSTDPSKINMGLGNLLPEPVYGLYTTRGASEFVTFCKTSLEPFCFPGKEGVVSTFVWEDKNGKKGVVSFLHTQNGAKLLWENGYFQDIKGHRLNPANGFIASVLDKQWITGKPGGEGDFRKIAVRFFESQGYTKQEAHALLQRIADSDTFSGDILSDFESHIWPGMGVFGASE